MSRRPLALALTPCPCSPVVKRSAEDQVAGTKFAMYGGRGVVQFNVVNMQELLKKKLE